MTIIAYLKKHGLKIATISASALIVLSMIMIIPTLYFRYSHNGTAPLAVILPKPKTAVVAASASNPLVSGEPVSISIPSVWINNVPIVPAVYNPKTGTWNVGLSNAQFVTWTTLPNNIQGDTYIYGHYRPAVFAYLHHIVAGALATVTTANGYTFTYKYIDTYATVPTDNSVFSYNGPPILTVQTCSGTFFQNRQLYVFDYLSYQKV